MGSLQGTDNIEDTARDGVRVMGAALTHICTRLELHLSAYNPYQSRHLGCLGWLRLHVAELKMMLGRSKPSEPLPGFRPSRRLRAGASPLYILRCSCHHHDPSCLRLALDRSSDEAKALTLVIKTG